MGSKHADKWDEVLEIVQFIRDNAASKQDLVNLRYEFNEKLQQTESRLLAHVDGFIQLYSKLDDEQAALRELYFRHDRNIGSLANHLGLSLE